LPVVDARRAIRALMRAGFVIDRISGSHYVMAHPGDPSRAVSVPFHGSKDLKPGTIRSIIRQAGLTVDEFAALL
jgi:predicted RNA binding protein YcfA (HicA-like mRNA interferase family)